MVSQMQLEEVMMMLVQRVLVAALTFVGACALSSCSDAWSRSQIDLTSFVGSTNADWPYLDAAEVTAEECPSLGCEQAVRSRYVSILKFPSVDAARRFAEGCDCHQIDPIVVRFDGEPVAEDVRREIIHTLSNINAEDPVD